LIFSESGWLAQVVRTEPFVVPSLFWAVVFVDSI
jgi:hypothetical protein